MSTFGYPDHLSRRAFLKLAAAGAAPLWMHRPHPLLAAEAVPHGAAPERRTLLLSKTGSDRATGYVMSNKLARRSGQLVCTWLDCQRLNRWAIVDPARGEIRRQGSVGQPQRDNHCGAALATGRDGTLHLLVGAHHGAFVHFRMPPDRDEWLPVEDGRAIGREATYPSVACDGQGTLHLTYRRETKGRDPHLCYCRRPPGGVWSEPRLLVASDVTEHSWLTNALEVGPDDRIHVVVSNTLRVPQAGPDARYYGVAHLFSDDSGRSWRQFGDSVPLTLPAPGGRLKRIENADRDARRVEAKYGGPRGPQHSYHHKMSLSNPVVDQRERPWVVVHNLLAGDAQLFYHEEPRGWRAVELLDAVRQVLPGFRIQHCGQLARHRDGTLECVLMVAPDKARGWGTAGTDLVRLLVNQDGSIRAAERVCAAAADVPRWLPTLERWCWHAPTDAPALLFTRGINAGGYDRNVNDVTTEVWLQVR